MNRKIIIITTALINFILTGCTAGFVKPEQGSPTMADSYQAAARGQSIFYPPSQKTTGLPVDECEEDTLRSLGEGGLMLRRIDSSQSEVPTPLDVRIYKTENGETSEINLPQLPQQQKTKSVFASVLDSQFPVLPNPQNLMYIFGHYADNGEIPVPGHFIIFSMYEKDHYALPDEIQKPYNDGQFME